MSSENTVTYTAYDATLANDRGQWMEVAATLGYHRSNPYAVTITVSFVDGPTLETWIVDRDQLAEGLVNGVETGPHGVVDISPPEPDGFDGDLLIMHRNQRGEYFTLTIDADFVDEFLTQTMLRVPAGEEPALVSSAIDRFLEEVLS